MIPTRPTLLTSCLGFWLTNRKDHPPSSWLLIHHWPYLLATSIIERNCTCKAIPLKREVGYKNVSLFGKLSRFSWNYGGLCSNFAPNSLSIDGRYSYAATQRKTRPEFSFVKESRNRGWGYCPCINLYHTCPAQTSASSAWQEGSSNNDRMMIWMEGWGPEKSLHSPDMFAVSCSLSEYSFIQ